MGSGFVAMVSGLMLRVFKFVGGGFGFLLWIMGLWVSGFWLRVPDNFNGIVGRISP